jgi:nucleoside-diphosphate-sugar epimerase
MQNVITGASGQLGSHIAEQLAARGEAVRALVRADSDTSFLKRLAVEIVTCDFGDATALQQALSGADVVYHCAARVSDWGPWQLFHDEIVEVGRRVLAGCQVARVGRVLFVSSISVYGHPSLKSDQLITEADTLGQHMWLWDYYAQAKIMAEQLAWQYPAGITVVRPSWIYGPRDRVTIPRVVPALRARRVPIIGSGDNLLNLIYAADVARGCILAAKEPQAAGQAYNLSSRGELTQRQMLDTLTDALGLPRIQRHVPFFLVRRVAFLKEVAGRLLRRPKPPTITRRAVYLIGRPARFSIEKARTQLGWEPQVGIQDGVKRTLEWYFAEQAKDAISP